MFFRCFLTLCLFFIIAAPVYCFDIVYPLAGHEFKPVQKGSLYVELASVTSSKDFGDYIYDYTLVDREIQVSAITLYGAYDINNRLSINIDLPYVYVNKKVGNNTTKNNAPGDVSAGLKSQLSFEDVSFTDSFFNVSITLPTGESPYENNTEIPTGSGGYSIKPEISVAKTIKNTLLFCSIFYQYNHPITGLKYHQYATDGEAGIFIKKVERGSEFGSSIGFVERLHENISCMIRYDFYRTKPIVYDWSGRDDQESESGDFSTMSMGIGFQAPSKLAFLTTYSVGIGSESPDYEFKLSVAF